MRPKGTTEKDCYQRPQKCDRREQSKKTATNGRKNATERNNRKKTATNGRKNATEGTTGNDA